MSARERGRNATFNAIAPGLWNHIPIWIKLLLGPSREGPRVGEVSEWLKEQHWKCCWRLKPPRGFESPPLRWCENLVEFTTRSRARHGRGCWRLGKTTMIFNDF